MLRFFDRHPGTSGARLLGADSWLPGVAVLVVLCGCSRNGERNADNAAPAAASSESPQADAAPPTPNGISAELVSKVEELIRLTEEYNSVAAQVQDAESFKQHRDTLSAIENQLSPVVEEVMIGQGKLTPQQSAEFDRLYYDTRAKPLIEAKAGHQQRIYSIVP